MINKSSSPSPGDNLRSLSYLFGLTLTLFCMVLGASDASAQTRAKRASAKSDERARRIDNEEVSDEEQSDEPERQAPPNPLVRKTALTYAPRSGGQAADRPALTNDIVIISRAKEAAPSRSPLAPKLGAGPSSIPSIWPVVGSLRSGVGVRRNPFGGPGSEFHKGQDISAPTGTPINVTADGVVIRAGWIKGYGNGIYVDHGNGITTRYGHLSRIDVAVGQTLKRGDHLGLVGSTGRSTGPHLHYEVRINGEPTSPLHYLPPVAPTRADTQPGLGN